MRGKRKTTKRKRTNIKKKRAEADHDRGQRRNGRWKALLDLEREKARKASRARTVGRKTLKRTVRDQEGARNRRHPLRLLARQLPRRVRQGRTQAETGTGSCQCLWWGPVMSVYHGRWRTLLSIRILCIPNKSEEIIKSSFRIREQFLFKYFQSISEHKTPRPNTWLPKGS